jgi:hypothetical protein
VTIARPVIVATIVALILVRREGRSRA